MIQLQQVAFQYKGGQPVFTQLSLAIEHGELIFVTGNAGSGKSTLLKLIFGLLEPSAGHVIVAGRNMQRLTGMEQAQYRQQVGYVGHDSRVLAKQTVAQNVELPLLIADMPMKQRQQLVVATLTPLGLIAKQNSYPSELAQNELQRLMVARALVAKPKILLLDMPTANLDQKFTTDMLRIITSCNETGITTVVATHDLSYIASLPHRVLVLQDGQLL